MDRRQIEKHKRRLSNRLPAIGGWLQRRSAAKLVAAGSPQAIGALAAKLETISDPAAKEIAGKAVWRASDQRTINAICAAWAENRGPWLGETLRRHHWVATAPPAVRTLSALWTGQMILLAKARPSYLEPLISACRDADEAIASRARQALAGLKVRETVDALCAAWAAERSPVLETALLAGGYIAARPVHVRVLTALKNERDSLLVRQGAETALALLDACQDRDPVIVRQARRVLRRLENPAARDAVCRMMIESGLDEDRQAEARLAALEAGYLPQDSGERALFLFLTGQWAGYEEIDFDRRLLRAAYEAANSNLRTRIIEKIRAAGRIDYLTIIAGGDYRARIARINPDEAQFLVRMLAGGQEWEKLWVVFTDLPFPAAIQSLHHLVDSGWQPASPDERSLLAELTQLAAAGLEQEPRRMIPLLPLAVNRARARVRIGRINALAFSPQGARLAIGSSQRKLAIWNFQTGERERVIGPADHSIGQVAFSGDGRLVYAERTNGQASCSVYVWQDGEAIRLWSHAGSITTLIPVGENQILSAGRDHRIALLKLNGRRKKTPTVQKSFWPRAACVSPSGNMAALFHYGAAVLDLGNLSTIAGSEDLGFGVARSALFLPQDEGLVVGFNRGLVQLFPLEPKRLEQRRLAQHTGPAEGLAILPQRDGEILLTAGAEGTLHFIGWAKSTTLGKINVPGERLTTLSVSPDGSFMATGDSNATFSLWDLRVLELPDLLTRPLAASTPNQFAALDVLLEHNELSHRVKNSLRFVRRILQHRFRYDIEIGAAPMIRLGEYEIEIE